MRPVHIGSLILLLFLAVFSTPGFQEQETAWVCPMHLDYTRDLMGQCPRCGMALVKAAPFDVRDYGLEFRTSPEVVRAGRPAKLQLTVTHPDTGAVVKKFEVVHEKQFHLFLISQDMDWFQHIHPEQQADGAWAIDATFPKPGYYKVLADFMPSGGSSQFLARPLVTSGYPGSLDAPKLLSDTIFTKTVDGLTATLAYDPEVCLVGLYCHLNFTLTEAGRPVHDLQTYLGAFGHTLIMSEDMMDYVHSHPLDILAQPDDDGGPPQFLIPPGADLEALRGGPKVTFEGLIPKPGRYRAWTQFRWHDKVHTFTFTFEAVPQ